MSEKLTSCKACGQQIAKSAKKCPHCGHTFQLLKRQEPRKYGCPLKMCTKCYKPYFDTDIKEPALYGYTNLYEIFNRIIGIPVAVIFAIGAIAFFIGGVYILISGEIIGLFSFLISGIFIYLIVRLIKRIVYYTKNRNDIILDKQIDFDDSITRLKNTDYLTSLAECDYRAKNLLIKRKKGYPERYAKRPK